MAEKPDQPGRYAGRLLSVKQVSQALAVNPATVRRWVKEGLLECVTMPKSGKGIKSFYRIRGSAVDKILEG